MPAVRALDRSASYPRFVESSSPVLQAAILTIIKNASRPHHVASCSSRPEERWLLPALPQHCSARGELRAAAGFGDGFLQGQGASGAREQLPEKLRRFPQRSSAAKTELMNHAPVLTDDLANALRALQAACLLVVLRWRLPLEAGRRAVWCGWPSVRIQPTEQDSSTG